ncbi:hypothetical protein CTI12_AA185310 [Artemisia annua]|uniref:MSP domain-containing protein n=1 Tax=Artemisia annua TaxID=35608 RepID=A0A2U1P7J3_ARTAN|nr:hypothetical protein CTI12_AA185310 [Artemisia annua]
MMKRSIRARVSEIVKNGFFFKKAKVQCSEYKHKFDPKKGFIVTQALNNHTPFHIAYVIKTTHPGLYNITPDTFIIKPHTKCVVTITRKVQDVELFDAEEKIYIESICVPEYKDDIVNKPKLALKVTPDIQETPSEVEERDLRTVTIVKRLFE